MTSSLLPYFPLLFFFFPLLLFLAGRKLYAFFSFPSTTDNYETLRLTTDLLLSSSTHTARLQPSTIITSDPANVYHILVGTTSFNYTNGPILTFTLRDLLGDGIFNSNFSDHWLFQRKTTLLLLSSKPFRSFAEDVFRREIYERVLPFVGKENFVFDLQDLVDRFAFDAFCRAFIGFDPGLLEEEDKRGVDLVRGLGDSTGLISLRARSPYWRFHKMLRLGPEGKLWRSIAMVNRIINDLVCDRREFPSSELGEDMLSRLVSDEKQGNSKYSDEFLRDMAVNLIMAGRDTIASVLPWFFLLVSRHKEVERKILEELNTIRRRRSQSDSPEFKPDELKQMVYLHATLAETMRLYPPLSLESRIFDGEDNDTWPDGTRVEKGSTVMVNIYAMGRMERLWGENCREFEPERWLGEKEDGGGVVFVGRGWNEYSVFWGGKKACLGKEMAFLQMKAVVAAVLGRFEVEVVADGREVERPELVTLLRVAGGLPVKFKNRTGHERWAGLDPSS